MIAVIADGAHHFRQWCYLNEVDTRVDINRLNFKMITKDEDAYARHFDSYVVAEGSWRSPRELRHLEELVKSRIR